MPFKTEQIVRLADSGWATCESVVEAVRAAGLPAISGDALDAMFDDERWARAEEAVDGLTERFAAARFAAEVRYGVLLVPNPARLDTRRPMSPAVRRDQLGEPIEDVFDARLPAGRSGLPGDRAWTMVATVTGAYGPALGSYDDVVGARRAAFVVDGVDTRALMTRQIWGARLLQGGPRLPDWEGNDRWTFTLFAGEPLTDGAAESGTVLKGRVRYRLGKADRRIGSARVAPAILIA